MGCIKLVVNSTRASLFGLSQLPHRIYLASASALSEKRKRVANTIA
jgi:hypothetical protein